MSVINQQPDGLSFSGNLKKFGIQSDTEVIFELSRIVGIDKVIIVNEKYQPDANGLLTIDITTIIDRLLEIKIPENQTIINEQPTAIACFFARVDNETIPLTVIKGGVSELQESASTWLASHFLTWQQQTKFILQTAPEWLGIYPIASGEIRLKAYYADNAFFLSTYALLNPNKLYSINTSWGAVSAWLIGQAVPQSGQTVAWDVWYEVNDVQMTPVQRYQLRNAGDEEHGFIWSNTLGGIDSASFTGSSEEDQKLEHKNAMYGDETIGEYDIDKAREIRQSTGFLNTEESRWLQDFFVSRKKYKIRADGSLKAIAVVSSKIVSISSDDQLDYEFTYRYGEDTQLLNIERTLSPLPAPEGLADFFLTELLSGLTEALYMGNLLIAVQNPFALGWQKLSLEQLRIGLLGSLVPGGIDDNILEELKKYIEGLAGNGVPDTRSILLSGAIMWESGLTYKSTKLVYKLFGEDYQISPQIMVLDAADSTFPRIDVFYVDSSSEIGVLKGTPAFVPVKPIVGENALEITQAYIPAGATKPDVDIETVFDENGPGEWTPAGDSDNDITIYFDATTAPVTGTKHIEVQLNIPDTTAANPTHYLGEKLGGGTVFYLALGGRSGLISAESPSSPGGGVWYESLSGGGYTTGANHSGIGGGLINTSILMAHHNAKNYAAKYAANYSKDGFTGWFMGSRIEMEQLIFRKSLFPNLKGIFWTSEEVEGKYNWKRALCVSFDNDATLIRDKNNAFGVVPIRAFNDDLAPIGIPVEVYTPSNTVLRFAAPAPIDFSNGIVSFWMKSSVEWLSNTAMTIRLYNDAALVGHLSMSKSSGMRGFNPIDPEWQLIGIQSSQFSMTGTTVNKLTISLVSSWPNNSVLSIDRIRIQHDSHQVPEDLIRSGIYGSPTKHVVLNINPQGKITNIKEVDATPVDEPLSGTVDGINRVFATSGPFESGTISVFVNGIKERHFTILSDTLIELDEAPKNIGFTDLIEAIYIKKAF